MTFSKFQISFNIPNEVHTVQSLLSSNHLARSPWPYVYRVGPQYPYITSFNPICCVTAEAFPRLSLMDILSVRKELEKLYSLVTTHGSTAEAGFGSSASDSQILWYGQAVKMFKSSGSLFGHTAISGLRNWELSDQPCLGGLSICFQAWDDVMLPNFTQSFTGA